MTISSNTCITVASNVWLTVSCQRNIGVIYYKNMARQFFDRVDFADNRVDSEHNQVNSGDPHTTSFELTVLKQMACHTFLAFLPQPCNQETLQGQMIACNINETTNLNWIWTCCLVMQVTPLAKGILVCMTIRCMSPTRFSCLYSQFYCILKKDIISA